MSRTARTLTASQREQAAGLVHPWIDQKTGRTWWIIGVRYRHLLCVPFKLGHGGPHKKTSGMRLVIQDEFEIAGLDAPRYSRRNDAMRGVFVYYEFPEEVMENTHGKQDESDDDR